MESEKKIKFQKLMTGVIKDLDIVCSINGDVIMGKETTPMNKMVEDFKQSILDNLPEDIRVRLPFDLSKVKEKMSLLPEEIAGGLVFKIPLRRVFS